MLRMRDPRLAGLVALVALVSGCGALGHRVGLDTVNSDIVFGQPSPSPRPPAAPIIPPIIPAIAVPLQNAGIATDLLPLTPTGPVTTPQCPSAPLNAGSDAPARQVDPKKLPVPGTYMWVFESKQGTTETSGFTDRYIRNVSAVTNGTVSPAQSAADGDSTYFEYTYQELVPFTYVAGPAKHDAVQVITWQVKQYDKFYDETDPESGLVMKRIDYLNLDGTPARAPFNPQPNGLLVWPLPLITGQEPTNPFVGLPGPSVYPYTPTDFRSVATDPTTGESYKLTATASDKADLIDACGKLVQAFSAEAQIQWTAAQATTNYGTIPGGHIHYTINSAMGAIPIFWGSSTQTVDNPNASWFTHIGQLRPDPLPTYGLPPAS